MNPAWTTTAPALTPVERRTVVDAATRAPNVLDTRPWNWIDGPAGLELRADSARMLRITDPLGRMLVISCGAALCNARLALRLLGRRPVVRLTPDPTDPLLLAVVGATPGTPCTPAEQALYDAIWVRHSNRDPFRDEPVEPGLLLHVLEAAVQYQVTASLLDDYQRNRLADLSSDAIVMAKLDHARVRENLRLTHGRYRMTNPPLPPAPHVVVLSTAGDTRNDWLRTGQALEQILLTATAESVASSISTEALELLEYRWRIRDLIAGSGLPQVVVRLGYPLRPAGGPAAPAVPVAPAAPGHREDAVSEQPRKPEHADRSEYSEHPDRIDQAMPEYAQPDDESGAAEDPYAEPFPPDANPADVVEGRITVDVPDEEYRDEYG